MEYGTSKGADDGLRFAADFAKNMKTFKSTKKRRLTPVSSENPKADQFYRDKFADIALSNQSLQEEDEDEDNLEDEEENQSSDENGDKQSEPVEIKGTYIDRNKANYGSGSPLLKDTLSNMMGSPSVKRKCTKDSGFGDACIESEEETPLPDWCCDCQVTDEDEKEISPKLTTMDTLRPRDRQRVRKVTPVPKPIATKVLPRSLSSDCLFVEEEDDEDIKIYNSDDDFIDPEIVTQNMSEGANDQPKWFGVIRKRFGFGTKGRSTSFDQSICKPTPELLFRYHSDGHDTSLEFSPDTNSRRRRGVIIKPTIDEILAASPCDSDSEFFEHHQFDDTVFLEEESGDGDINKRIWETIQESKCVIKEEEILNLTKDIVHPEVVIREIDELDDSGGAAVPLWMKMAEAKLTPPLESFEANSDNEREDSDEDSGEIDAQGNRRVRKKSRQKRSSRQNTVKVQPDQSTKSIQSEDQDADLDVRKIYNLAPFTQKHKRRKLTPMDKETPSLDMLWECRRKPLQWMPVPVRDEAQVNSTGNR